jgi:uncharacterized protein (DUF2147 family)
MAKRWIFKLFFFLSFFTGLTAEDDILGFWKSVDDKTGKPQCIVAVYQYKGISYGRIIGTYNKAGKMDDTIYHPKGRAPGIQGDPFYAGLDLIWDMKNGGVSYKGKIVDPEKGNVYNAELWRDGPNLVVRGKLLMFGRNQTWLPAMKDDFPKGFKKPDVSQFIPSIPQVK